MSVLVVSWDRVGEMMAGSAVRALEMARALAAGGLDVVLAAPDGSRHDGTPGLRLVEFPRERSLAALVDDCDVVVISGRIELMSVVRKPLVVDLYDPFILSNLDLYGEAFARSGGRPLLELRWLQRHLENGDFFLCASPAQRAFWLGMLAAAGRINRANYERDSELRGLIDLVPFGVPDEPPVAGEPVVKGIVPGIGGDDRVVLWAGGMWNWVDPLTLVRAMALLRERRPDVKALILGTRHPNPEIGEMQIAGEARDLARELGLLDDGVSFLGWVPYVERHRYILESDVGISLHRRGVESEFAFRTRLLDYVWGLLPMVVTSGDDLAARVEREDLGCVVPAEDPVAVAAAIEAVLDDPEPARRRARLEAARSSFAWSRAVAPLLRFCRAPHRAPDRETSPWFEPGGSARAAVRREEAEISEEFVTDARAISTPLGPDYAPAQGFRAAEDGLGRVDVLVWVEPPVAGWNLVFELYYVGDPPEFAARVVVPAAQLPHCDWQRFEFAPLAGSRDREFEFRLRLVAAGAGTGSAGGVAPERPPGRVSVWRCAPPDGVSPAGDAVAFIARYLVGGLVERMPGPPRDFLFVHGTTLAPREPLDPALPVATSERATESSPPDGIAHLRAELARVSYQAAAAEKRVADLERGLEARDARVSELVLEIASAAARTEIARTPILIALFQDLLHLVMGVGRLGMRVGKAVFVVALSLACVVIGAGVGIGAAAVDGLAWLAARVPGGRRPSPPPEFPPVAGDDAVSIVIPTWNGRELLDMSLPPLIEAVRRHGRPGDEIIVVDNGSDDGTVAALATLADEVPFLRTVALDRNEGFAGATNRGAREAVNPVLILLNNDMVVEPDFIQPLLDAFVEEPRAFGISCQIDFIDPSKPRWETGKVHARLEGGLVRLFHLDRFDADLLYPIFFAGGGASAYHRGKFLALEGFDEEVFSPVYIEDVDLGYRAWKRGWPALLAPRSMVHHKHRGTTRRLWSEGVIHSFFVKNLAALLWKNACSWSLLGRHLAGLPRLPFRVRREQGGRSAWATTVGLARQVPRTLRARLRESRTRRVLGDAEIFHLSRYRHAYRSHFHPEPRDPAARPQVLLVSPYSPVPAVHGGATRIQNLIRELGATCDVTLVSFFDTDAEARPESLLALRDLCRDAVLVPRDLHGRGGRLWPNQTVGFHSAKMFEEIEHWLDRRRFDVVQVEYTHMAHYLPPPSAGLLRVLVEHDIAFVAVARARAQTKSARRRLALWIDGLRMLRYEVAAVEGADLVLTMSDVDRGALGRFVDTSHVRTVPNGVSCAGFPARTLPAEPATILFVGFFRHDPNVEAVLYFAREVLPRVRERIPGVRFRVVGAYPPPVVRDLATSDPSIEVTGMVAETASHYRRATVFVAPILRGSGTRLKILEAMASGCAVVSTTIGAEGLGASAGEIRIADAPDAFAAAVAELIGDETRREAQERRARRFVEQRYDWSAIARGLVEVYGFTASGEEAGASPRGARRLAAGGPE